MKASPEQSVRASESDVNQIIDTIASDAEARKTALPTMRMYLHNVLAHEFEPKYHRIGTQSAFYTSRVAPFAGTDELFRAVGFELENDFWIWRSQCNEEYDRVKALLSSAVARIDLAISASGEREVETAPTAPSSGDSEPLRTLKQAESTIGSSSTVNGGSAAASLPVVGHER